MFEGVNDSDDDAYLLIDLLRQVDYMVNLIPYNSVSGTEFKRPARDRILAFQEIIMKAGKKAFIRREKGADIAAACGQLAGGNKGS